MTQYSFKGFGFNLRVEDNNLIQSMFKVVTDEIPEIYDLRSYEAEELAPNDIVFLYGKRAVKTYENISCASKIIFPDITRLDATFGDQQERANAYQTLLQLKDKIENDRLLNGVEEKLPVKVEQKTITKKMLPKLSSERVLELETTLKKQGIASWTGETEDGRKIRLTIDPEDSDADIDMTFKELYALKTCIEVLQVKEMNIAYKPTSSTNKNSS